MVDFLNALIMIFTYVFWMSIIALIVLGMYKLVTYIFKSRRNY